MASNTPTPATPTVQAPAATAAQNMTGQDLYAAILKARATPEAAPAPPEAPVEADPSSPPPQAPEPETPAAPEPPPAEPEASAAPPEAPEPDPDLSQDDLAEPPPEGADPVESDIASLDTLRQQRINARIARHKYEARTALEQAEQLRAEVQKLQSQVKAAQAAPPDPAEVHGLRQIIAAGDELREKLDNNETDAVARDLKSAGFIPRDADGNEDWSYEAMHRLIGSKQRLFRQRLEQAETRLTRFQAAAGKSFERVLQLQPALQNAESALGKRFASLIDTNKHLLSNPNWPEVILGLMYVPAAPRAAAAASAPARPPKVVATPGAQPGTSVKPATKDAQIKAQYDAMSKARSNHEYEAALAKLRALKG